MKQFAKSQSSAAARLGIMHCTEAVMIGLPAESVVVAEPGMQGPAISGPSFKVVLSALSYHTINDMGLLAFVIANHFSKVTTEPATGRNKCTL
eukprot:scaffold33218_cov20-Tisochrysis_lutea.AAC.1